MKASQLHIPTLKETPSDAELVSHRLMLRAGFIQKHAAGLYSWLPLGLRVLNKVAKVVREEMDAIGGNELLMPIVQPAELWQETGRWEKFGPQLLTMTDRHEREFCFGPTHEEVVTDLIRTSVSSYKKLPLTVYQIQTKFRDEIRPRFGVMRAREFMMKDAYSFHLGTDSLNDTYQDMFQAYSNVCTRLGLEFRAVEADTGAIGGSASHEFHVLAEAGEDLLLYSGTYAANVELATTKAPARENGKAKISETRGCKAIKTAEQAKELGVDERKVLKTLIVKGVEGPVALCIAGDDELNEVKAIKHPLVAEPFALVDEAELKKITGCGPGFVGPKLELPIIADPHALALADFAMGANKDGCHFIGVNWGRDLPEPEVFDLRCARAGDTAPDGSTLAEARGIEVGHIFALGDTYSKAMNATVLDEGGKPQAMQMGCYGIGVSRIVAAAIEQHHDDNGMLWPDALAPFTAVIVVIGKDEANTAALELYNKMKAAGIDVLLDDRAMRPGVKFAEMDLIGIPHRLVVSDKLLTDNVAEYKSRRSGETQMWALAEVCDKMSALMS